MTPDVLDIRDLLPLYALGGILAPDEERAVEAAVARDPVLAEELAAYRDAAAELIVPATPSPEVEKRLMASVGGGRFERFAAQLGMLYDVTVERAREILGLAERSASWDAAMPGIGLVHFDGGPACAAADCGFIRLADGAVFPFHSHKGEEVSLILSGQVRTIVDGAEQIISAGETLVMPEGSAHDLTAIGGECVFAARVIDGIEIGGVPARPPKPDR
jgi:mannose-6-phosphate isomerase-like protein (cupin superfamily)